jgi:hypothetical protein
MEMTRDDFRAVRHVLRFAGIGVTPDPSVVDRAVDRVAQHFVMLPDVQASMERLRAGILPSQQACQEAEVQLAGYFERQDSPADRAAQRMTH